jgi:hypothetical protein
MKNVALIETRVFEGGHPNGVNHERKTDGNEGGPEAGSA